MVKPFIKGLIQISENSFDFSDYGNVLGNDRVHEIILRLKSDVIRFLIESLHCCAGFISVIDKCYNDLSVVSFMRFLNDEIVSVIDAYVDHAVTVNGEYKVVARSYESCRHRELVYYILLSKDRFTCSYLSDYRQGHSVDIFFCRS